MLKKLESKLRNRYKFQNFEQKTLKFRHIMPFPKKVNKISSGIDIYFLTFSPIFSTLYFQHLHPFASRPLIYITRVGKKVMATVGYF